MTVHMTCLLFGGVEQLIAGMELQRDKMTLSPVPHYWVLDDCYPLNRSDNLRLLQQVKKRHEDTVTVFHNTENMGIHRSFNRLCSLMPLADEDIIITVAPDSVPLSKGWDEAMVRVLNAAPSVAYVGTSSFAIDKTPVTWTPHVADGVHYITGSGPAMSHATAWRWSFLKAVGGFHQPHAYYGHLEAQMFARAQGLGMTHAYLVDHREDFRLEGYHDDVYRRYKIAQAHTYSFPGSFKEYLEAGHK